MSIYKVVVVTTLVAFVLAFAGCGGGGNTDPTYMISVGRIKELDHALLLYAGDVDDVFPLATSWMDGLGPYVTDPLDFHSPAVGAQGYGYALNADLAGRNLSSVASPDMTPSIFDSTDLNRNATDNFSTQPNPPRYHGRNTVGFADGHVQDELGIHPSLSALFTQSQSRIKTLNTGMLMYASDFDGHLPLAANWVDSTFPYIRTISSYRSPLIERLHATDFGYAYNSALSGVDSTTLDRGTTVTFFDSTILTRNAASDLSTLPRPPRYRVANTIVYMDGHIGNDGQNPTIDQLYSQSQSRMRQLAAGISAYAADFDDHLPLADSWMDSTYPYTHDSALYRSPLIERQNQGGYGYAFNSNLVGIDLSGLQDPSTMPVLFDSTVLTRNATASTSTMPSPARYNGKNTIAYADGHVP